MNDREKWLNIPNGLSVYRLAVVPVILFAIFTGHRMLFAWLVLISLVTDIIDGLLARAWHEETPLGARLDSIADLATYFLVILGMTVLERPFILDHGLEISLLLAFYAASQLVSVARFRHFISLHLYSSKLTAIMQGLFFGAYFLFSSHPALFHAMIVVGILNNIEELIVLFLLRENRLNARGLYWVLQERRREADRGEIHQQRRRPASK